jgi:Domain of unknown function (DUF4105)
VRLFILDGFYSMKTSPPSPLQKERCDSSIKVYKLKLKQLFIGCTFLLSFSLNAQKLSPEAHISLITLGPTQKELYSAFGHSAIRVYDPASGTDYFFNYGVFSFNQPNFYLNFARGRNMYQLGVYNYVDARDYYISENRFIHEQILNFSASQKQLVFDFLMNNARPENKLYLYDYFYDNCATRPRDVLKTVFGDSIQFDETPEHKPITIRGLTDIYLGHQPWGDLGIDICLGMPMDKVASRSEYMFLPDSLESGFDRARIKSDSVWTGLVKEKIIVFDANEQEPGISLTHPWIVFVLVALGIFAISYRDLKRRKTTGWLDKILFITTGVLGLLLVLLWTATSHKAAANNLNVFWALPTNLIFPFVGKLKKKYFLFAISLTAGLILSWFFLPQQLHVFLIPIVIALGARYWVNYKLA